ncbi:hypothetical protein HUJ04_004053 [Dendroctonus ponderosae]|uniref:Alpha-mannosidase n=2 Tax=Dendroctonus ponderosae TaxID=77166 RepID=A0AAR5PZQ1_DENPD|nr:hypothetical protein HUJ04_004053 [Dendroctonus ponderosae]
MAGPRSFSVLLLVAAHLAFAQAECGYASCHPVKEDHVNIHLVPHSHDDLGWLKTFEQYYYGSHDNVQRAGVQYIISSVVDALKSNKDRRFIYVETGYFWKWWTNQEEDVRSDVRQLVNNGQLEFISGGWSMNDEATTYYQDTIDQMTWGLRRLNDTFGECGRPRVAWQIDPFGHSREMASIFAQIGFDGFFLNRIDSQDLQIRRTNKQMEFVWRGSPDNLGESTDIYSNVLFRHYSAPSGLCFDVNCADEPIIDDPESPEYNVENKVRNFISDWITPARSGYASDNILVPMGDDFQYQAAGKNFANIDKLIRYMSGKEIEGVKYNVIYSTPSCYLNAVYEATNGVLDVPLKTDDFFPYGSSDHTYWSGYFTSRPTGKGYNRFSNNFLQVCKQLSVLTDATSDEDTAKLNTLREALGVFQHHDGITGTEKENVAHDYIHLLHKGITECEDITSQALAKLTQAADTEFTTCHMLNISECAVAEKEESFVLTLYNPLGRPVSKYVRLPVVDDNEEQIDIRNPSGGRVIAQIVPIHESVLAVPGRNSEAKFDLVFVAEDIPALGYKSYFIQRTRQKSPAGRVTKSQAFPGKLRSLAETLGVSVEFQYYTGNSGDSSSADSTPSTPYIFRPHPDIPLQAIEVSHVTTYSGPLLTEDHVYYNDWFSAVVRHYNDSLVSEYVHLVGPLPYDENGVEVIVRFTADFEGKVYTDTNGREFIERIRNFRPTWNITVVEPEAANYYPVTTGISIQDGSTKGIVVLNDRAQGGGSVVDQTIELMIHRNTKKDGQGVGEALNEEAFGVGVVTRGSHLLIPTGSVYASPDDLTPKEISQQIALDAWIFFSSPNGASFEEYQESHLLQFSAINSEALPRNVHLLTLEPWGDSTVLLRLENFFGQEDEDHSDIGLVNLQDLFTSFKVLSLRETTLGANQYLQDNNRIRFNVADAKSRKIVQEDDDFIVILEPMQIRTFILKVSY